MAERMDWVFSHPCGCPFGVMVMPAGSTRSRAWREFFDSAKERDEAMDRGVTAVEMSHAAYVAEVSPKLAAKYRCPHEVAR